MDEIKKIAETMQQIQIDIAEIKVDLSHHIKRSDAHESDLAHLMRVKYMLYGAVSLLTLFASIYGVFR